eukprot:3397542-Alexandrium_andersonii.AAC.1
MLSRPSACRRAHAYTEAQVQTSMSAVCIDRHARTWPRADSKLRVAVRKANVAGTRAEPSWQ